MITEETDSIYDIYGEINSYDDVIRVWRRHPELIPPTVKAHKVRGVSKAQWRHVVGLGNNLFMGPMPESTARYTARRLRDYIREHHATTTP
jgi:hypothetical protein